MHPVQSPIFLKRVSKTENCSLLGRAAFQLKRDSRPGPLLEAQAGRVLSETLEGRAALSSEQTEWRVESGAQAGKAISIGHVGEPGTSAGKLFS